MTSKRRDVPDKLPLVDVTGQPLPSRPEPAVPEQQYAADEVGPGKRVCMHFSVGLTNGELIDDNFGQKPVQFDIGDGNLLPDFERAIFGLRAGQRHRAELPPEQAFGEVNEANIQHLPRYQFPADLPLEKGMVLGFGDAAGNEQPGVVIDADKTEVTVDFNHPLAGRTIVFTVHILSVEQADHD